MKENTKLHPSLSLITFRFIVISLLVCISGSAFFLYAFVPDFFLEQGEQYFERKLDRLTAGLEELRKRLLVVGGDAAFSRETATFVSGKSYFFSSADCLKVDFLARHDCDILILKDATGKDVHTAFYDHVKQTVLVGPPGISDAIAPVAAEVMTAWRRYGA